MNIIKKQAFGCKNKNNSYFTVGFVLESVVRQGLDNISANAVNGNLSSINVLDVVFHLFHVRSSQVFSHFKAIIHALFRKPKI